MKRLVTFVVFALIFSMTAQAQTPTPSFLSSGIYNQNHAYIGISGSYNAVNDASFYLGDAFSFPYIFYSSDQTSGGTAIGNMSGGDGLAAAFDNNAGTRAQNTGTTGIIGYDFGAANDKTIGRYTIQQYSGAATTQAPMDFTLQSSPDNSAWTTRDTRTGQSFTSGEIKTYTVATMTSARYWRINITNNNGGANTSVAEVEMMSVSITTPTVSFYFLGDEFSLLSTRSANGPELQVCIDSTCSNVSQYAPSTTQGISATFGNLVYGIHSVSISRLTSGGTNDFVFDGIIVAPQFDEESASEISISVTLEAPPTEAYRYGYIVESLEGTPQAVNFDYSANVGDVITGALLFSIVLVMLTALLVYIFSQSVGEGGK